MEQYHDLVRSTLQNESSTYKPNRTNTDTISTFGKDHTIDVSHDDFPLLTTKDMSNPLWNSILSELFWFLSGDEHIRELQKETRIWNPHADNHGRLDTAYPRFWRRYPVPDPAATLDGETWAGTDNEYVQTEQISETDFVNAENMPTSGDGTRYTFDQIGYVLNQLKNNPTTRRMVVTAWHPANAAVSELPPCHYTFVLNVQGDTLNLHLTQRSGDIALGIPFNIASYSLLLLLLADETGYKPGQFHHSIVDAHIYCGADDRGRWYEENLPTLQKILQRISNNDPDNRNYSEVADWIEERSPAESNGKEGLDHVPGLLRQLDRAAYDRPSIQIPDKPFDQIEKDDIKLTEYESHERLNFEVAT